MKTIVAIMLGLAGIASAELSVEAQLDRSSMSTDDAAVLTVTVEGGRQVDIDLPDVEGLSYQRVGNSTNMQFINGAMSVSVTQQIVVRAAEAGSYEIPKIRAAAGGEEAYSKAALKLEVVKGTGQGGASVPNMGTNSGRAAAVPAEDVGELAFVTVKPARTEVVVGELVPVEVKAYFRDGVGASLRSMPTVEGGSFTLKNQEGNPRREQVTVDGVGYTALTFYSGMAAVKPGKFPVEVGLEATLSIREKGNRRSGARGMRSLFNDPFFGGDPFAGFDDFFGRTVQKEVSLKAEPVEVTVAEVPAEGRPEGFGGAVGEFSVTASLAGEGKVEVGEPVTVKLTVEGKGNFDRVAVPGLAEGEGWKAYPATSDFVEGDAIGYSGTKVFEQVIIPERGGVDGVEFELAYYNGREKRFEVARSGVVALEVTGEAVDAPVVADGAAVVKEEARTPEVEEELGVRAVRPLYGRWWFVGTCGVSVLVLGFCGVAGLARGRKADPGLAVARVVEREIGEALAGMERAMGEANAVAFFGAMRRAVQLRVGRSSGVPADGVTAADVGDGELKEMLMAADAVVFSGMPVEVEEMGRWLGKAETLKS